jgi:hypothetical protein
MVRIIYPNTITRCNLAQRMRGHTPSGLVLCCPLGGLHILDPIPVDGIGGGIPRFYP